MQVLQKRQQTYLEDGLSKEQEVMQEELLQEDYMKNIKTLRNQQVEHLNKALVKKE